MAGGKLTMEKKSVRADAFDQEKGQEGRYEADEVRQMRPCCEERDQ